MRQHQIKIISLWRLRGRRVAGILAIVTGPALAASPFDPPEGAQPSFDPSQVDVWSESAVTIPAYPQDADLIALPLGRADTLKVFLDRQSLSRAADRVARYTLVVESPRGARSVYYEGMRCETREYKTYAVGTTERAFRPNANAAWREIPVPSTNAFRHVLYRRHVCDGGSARAPEALIQALTGTGDDL